MPSLLRLLARSRYSKNFRVRFRPNSLTHPHQSPFLTEVFCTGMVRLPSKARVTEGSSWLPSLWLPNELSPAGAVCLESKRGTCWSLRLRFDGRAFRQRANLRDEIEINLPCIRARRAIAEDGSRFRPNLLAQS